MTENLITKSATVEKQVIGRKNVIWFRNASDTNASSVLGILAAGVLAMFLLFGIGLNARVFAASAESSENSPTVGMSAKISQIVLPGAELEVRPIDPSEPIVLRIAAVYPHGTDFRYDLVYYGLDPGDYDLKDYLQRKDGSSTDDLPSLPVTIHSVLPPGQIMPHELTIANGPRLGGYRILLIAGAVVWGLGLLAILLIGRKNKRSAQAAAAPPTFADRLKPIVEGAITGTVSSHELAGLERTLLAYWRRRLGLQQTSAAESVQVLRQHEEAGPLLNELEVWLHQPPGGETIDVKRLLEPYQNIPADEFIDPQPQTSS